jgi:hypothetical protein
VSTHRTVERQMAVTEFRFGSDNSRAGDRGVAAALAQAAGAYAIAVAILATSEGG